MSERCPICENKYKEADSVYIHMEKEHSDQIPKDFSAHQYFYSLKTGKDHGNCVVCHKSTTWNKATGKYNRFCENPKCKDTYREEFKKRMIGKYGKVHLLDEPDKQKEMLHNRSISGDYIWSDGKKIPYTGTYELDFLKIMDNLMGFESDDIMAPSPHVYYYEYEGEKKFYIPDFFIPSLNLEIEVKDSAKNNPNMHPKIQGVDKVKEKLKDEVLMSQKEFNYIKITGKSYEPFFKFLNEAKKQYATTANDDDVKEPIFILGENLTTVTEGFNPGHLSLMSSAIIMVYYFVKNERSNYIETPGLDAELDHLFDKQPNLLAYFTNYFKDKQHIEHYYFLFKTASIESDESIPLAYMDEKMKMLEGFKPTLILFTRIYTSLDLYNYNVPDVYIKDVRVRKYYKDVSEFLNMSGLVKVITMGMTLMNKDIVYSFPLTDGSMYLLANHHKLMTETTLTYGAARYYIDPLLDKIDLTIFNVYFRHSREFKNIAPTNTTVRGYVGNNLALAISTRISENAPGAVDYLINHYTEQGYLIMTRFGALLKLYKVKRASYRNIGGFEAFFLDNYKTAIERNM